MNLLAALRSGTSVFAAELRPPRAELETREGMDAWIDTYHAVRRLTRQGTFVFLTDNAVGAQEEDNLRHLVTNLGKDVPRERIVPFLTSKHSKEFCLSYAERAHQHGFPALVVLGGDKSVGTPRCVEHAWQLRQMLRERDPSMTLGGWANPHADPERQVDYLAAADFHGEFYLTQVVSHHHADQVSRFVDAAERRGLTRPGMFGVFFYRSANPRTLESLKHFLPVPADGLTREFAAGATAEDVCARTIRTLMDVGVKHFYVSNLPVSRAQHVLASILEKVAPAAMPARNASSSVAGQASASGSLEPLRGANAPSNSAGSGVPGAIRDGGAPRERE
jgi:5,10-methylenetetrahydrofolate reductase